VIDFVVSPLSCSTCELPSDGLSFTNINGLSAFVASPNISTAEPVAALPSKIPENSPLAVMFLATISTPVASISTSAFILEASKSNTLEPLTKNTISGEVEPGEPLPVTLICKAPLFWLIEPEVSLIAPVVLTISPPDKSLSSKTIPLVLPLPSVVTCCKVGVVTFSVYEAVVANEAEIAVSLFTACEAEVAVDTAISNDDIKLPLPSVS